MKVIDKGRKCEELRETDELKGRSSVAVAQGEFSSIYLNGI